MIRLQLPIVNSTSGREIYNAVTDLLCDLPRFSGTTLAVKIVVHRGLLFSMANMRHEDDLRGDRSVVELMLERFKYAGLVGFVSDDDDEIAEAEADRDLLALLRSHPQAGHLLRSDNLLRKPTTIESERDRQR